MTVREEIAEKLGVDPEQIKKVSLQLSVLRNQGLLIDLNVSGTGMFARSANWGDIGIAEDENDPRYNRFTTGQKYLIPEKKIKQLRSIETRMRQWLDRFSYEVTGFAPFRWLPYTAYDTWREKWAELLADFNQVKAEIIAERESYEIELANTFAQIADASWKSITAQGYEWVIQDGVVYGRDEFIDMVVRSALEKMPTEGMIEEKLHADYVTALVYGNEDLAADELKAQQIRDQARLESEKTAAARREATAQAQMLEAQEHHQRQLQILERDHLHEMQQLEEDEKRLKINTMLKIEAEHAREQLNRIVSPFEEVFAALRTQFAQDAETMLVSVKKNGFVRGKIAEKAHGLLEVYDLLAVQDDRELRAKLIELKDAIGPVGQKNAPERNTEQVQAILEEIKELSHQAARDVALGPSRFSLLDIGEDL